jgi:hypothetical protein
VFIAKHTEIKEMEDVVAAYFMILSRYSPEGLKKNKGKHVI